MSLCYSVYLPTSASCFTVLPSLIRPHILTTDVHKCHMYRTFSPKIEENHVRSCSARIQSSLKINLAECSSFLVCVFILSL